MSYLTSGSVSAGGRNESSPTRSYGIPASEYSGTASASGRHHQLLSGRTLVHNPAPSDRRARAMISCEVLVRGVRSQPPNCASISNPALAKKVARISDLSASAPRRSAWSSCGRWDHGGHRTPGTLVAPWPYSYTGPATPMRWPSGSVRCPTTTPPPGFATGPMMRVPPRRSASCRADSTSGTPT